MTARGLTITLPRAVEVSIHRNGVCLRTAYIDKVKLNANEAACLRALSEDYGHECNCIYFREVAMRTGLEVNIVRRACRSLARKGLAAYERGLFNEDGEVAGSGYCCTSAGARFIEAAGTPA